MSETPDLMTPAPTESPYAELSIAQERLWVFEKLFPRTCVNNHAVLVSIQGSLSLSLFQSGLNTILRRQPEVGSVVVTGENDGPRIVPSSASIAAEVCTLADTSGTNPAESALQIATERCRQPFDLSSEPLLRIFAFPISPETHLLLFIWHGILLDQESGTALVKQTVIEYSRLKAPSSEKDPEPQTSEGTTFRLPKNEQGAAAQFDVSLQYWKKRLQGVLRSPELPIAGPRPNVRSFRSSRKKVQIPADVARRIATAAGCEGSTSVQFILSAFLCLLYRYSGQEQILIGTYSPGEHQNAENSAIGCFRNYLPLQIGFAGDLPFHKVLRKVVEEQKECQQHDAVPFEYLAAKLAVELDPTRHPLFQILFREKTLPQEWNLTGISARAEDLPTGFSEFDLVASVRTRSTIEFELEYSSDLFDASTIERMLGHVLEIVQAAAENPTLPVSKLPLLTPKEGVQLLERWNDTRRNYTQETLLHELFENRVTISPDSIAVKFGRVELAYRELNNRANQLARHLRKLNVGPDTLVGVCMERSLNMIVALLGVLKAGAAYVPLDPSYPKSRLEFMLADSGLRVLLTEEQLKELWANDSVELVCIDRDWDKIQLEEAGNTVSGATPENLAYVIYTSGSTGRPKGVQISHRAVVNFVETMRGEPGITSRDTLLALTTISFDIAGLEIYVPLAVGGRVVIADRQTAMDGRALANHLRSDQITVMQATPVTWQLLLESGWEGKSDLKALIGGEALTRELANRLISKTASLWNMYGPTETTIWSTLGRISGETGPILIGRPIANTTIYILDESLQPVPVGVPGELYIGGDGLARGYLNRPDLTNERFIQNPFRNETRIYKTGDLARYHANGSIECLGRADNQVKIRGFRIELGEIESTLLAHPGLRQAAVIAQEDVPGNKRLVAYLVAKSGPTPDIKELGAFLKGKLPAHMVPSDYFYLAELPLTPNGKVDRKALPLLPPATRPNSSQFCEPRTPTEATLGAIWGEVLGVSKVSVRDSFFDIGGNSLLAARLFTRINNTFGVELSLNSLFNSPTIEQLSAHIDSPAKKRPRHQLVPIQPNGKKTPLFWIPGGRATSVLGFRETAVHLGSDQPVYGVESRLPDPGESFEPVERRAEEYLRLILQVQPVGPYYLAGFCTGGMVVFDMAQRLRAKGEKVALLALVQAAVPGYPRTKIEKFKIRFFRSRYLAGSFAKFIAMRVSGKFIKFRRGALQEIHTRVAKLFLGWIGTSSQLPDPTEVDNDSVANRYQPEKYPGNVDIFLAEDCFESIGIPGNLDPRLRWHSLISGPIQVHTVRGDHYTMLTGLNAKNFAEQLGACLCP